MVLSGFGSTKRSDSSTPLPSIFYYQYVNKNEFDDFTYPIEISGPLGLKCIEANENPAFQEEHKVDAEKSVNSSRKSSVKSELPLAGVIEKEVDLDAVNGSSEDSL